MSQQTVKEAVAKTAQMITDNPNSGKLIYKADTKWEGDVKCSVRVREFDALMIDEPAAFGGGDTAMSPADLILAALGSCQEIMYSALASTMDIPLEKVSVKLEGKLDLRGLLGMGKEESIPPGFQDIRYETSITSSADEQTLQNLVELVESQCPILDTLQRPINVSGQVTFN